MWTMHVAKLKNETEFKWHFALRQRAETSRYV